MRALPLLGALALLACNDPPNAALEHLRRGDEALARRRVSAAMIAYARAREVAPESRAVQRAVMRARVYDAALYPEHIATDAIEAIRYDAKLLLDTDAERADVYSTALGNLLVASGDLDGAKVSFAEAQSKNPSSPLPHAALGLALAARKETVAQARAELEAALALEPGIPNVLRTLGEIELAQGDLARASDRLDAALRASDDFATRMALGTLRMRQQRAADAIPCFERASRLDPRSADALRSLGEALLAAGKPAEAERALRAAAQLKTDEVTTTALGFALERQKKLEPALAVFQSLLRDAGDSAPALYGAGVASEGLGRVDQALAYYRRLLAVPAGGGEVAMLGDLRKDAQARAAALEATAKPAAAKPGAGH